MTVLAQRVYWEAYSRGSQARRERIQDYIDAHDAYVAALLEEDDEFLRAKTAAAARTDETARRMARVRTKGEALKAEARMLAARALMEGR